MTSVQRIRTRLLMKKVCSFDHTSVLIGGHLLNMAQFAGILVEFERIPPNVRCLESNSRRAAAC